MRTTDSKYPKPVMLRSSEVDIPAKSNQVKMSQKFTDSKHPKTETLGFTFPVPFLSNVACILRHARARVLDAAGDHCGNHMQTRKNYLLSRPPPLAT